VYGIEEFACMQLPPQTPCPPQVALYDDSDHSISSSAVVDRSCCRLSIRHLYMHAADQSSDPLLLRDT